MESKTAEDFLLGALIGGAIGAATALMLTPFSGEALRNKIRNGLPYLEERRPRHHARKRSLNALAGIKRSVSQAKSRQKDENHHKAEEHHKPEHHTKKTKTKHKPTE